MGASAIGLSHVAVQFPVYEFLKRWLGERRQKERGEASAADRLSTVDLILASSTSKVIGFGFPHVPSAPLPAYQHAVCASVATVTPPDNVFTCPCLVCYVLRLPSIWRCTRWVVERSPNQLLRNLLVCCMLFHHTVPPQSYMGIVLCYMLSCYSQTSRLSLHRCPGTLYAVWSPCFPHSDFTSG